MLKKKSQSCYFHPALTMVNFCLVLFCTPHWVQVGPYYACTWVISTWEPLDMLHNKYLAEVGTLMKKYQLQGAVTHYRLCTHTN